MISHFDGHTIVIIYTNGDKNESKRFVMRGRMKNICRRALNPYSTTEERAIEFLHIYDRRSDITSLLREKKLL